MWVRGACCRCVAGGVAEGWFLGSVLLPPAGLWTCGPPAGCMLFVAAIVTVPPGQDVDGGSWGKD